MRWFKDLKIFTKILLLVLITAVSLAVVGFMGYRYMTQMRDQAREMYAEHLLPVGWLNITRNNFRAVEADIWQLILTSDKTEEQRLVKDIDQQAQEANTLLAQYEKLNIGQTEKERLAQLKTAMQEYRAERQRAIDLAVAGDKPGAYAIYRSAAGKIEDQTSLLRDLAQKSSKDSDALAEEIAAEAAMALKIVFGVVMLAIVLCGVMGIAIAREIARSVSKLQILMAKAGAGDLTVHGDIESKDEIGELTASFNLMMRRQSEVVGMVRKAAVELSAASEEMAASCEEVNAATEEVARSMHHVTETTAQGNTVIVEASQSLVHLSSLIQIAKSKATSAVADSQKTLRAATGGQETVRETVACMGTISEKTKDTETIIATLSNYSTQIASITDTITGIASQTNLLALNAAIEAARAGEAGRGFAVVAEEVRKLAEQSSQGASEVAALVQKVAESTEEAVAAMRQSNVEVIRGVEVVNKAGTALDDIVTEVNSTVSDIGGVLSVTNEEVASSDKVVELINRLASVIETTAAQAEEVASSTEQTSAAMQTVAASSEEGSAMANDLKAMVDVFKVAGARELDAVGLLEQAKSDHLLWKMRVANMLQGIETLTENELTSHSDCRLGKWYFALDNPYKNDADFRAVDEPHKQVHEYAKQAVIAYQAGDKKKAAHYAAMLGRNSDRVLILLDRLIKKIGK